MHHAESSIARDPFVTLEQRHGAVAVHGDGRSVWAATGRPRRRGSGLRATGWVDVQPAASLFRAMLFDHACRSKAATIVIRLERPGLRSDLRVHPRASRLGGFVWTCDDLRPANRLMISLGSNESLVWDWSADSLKPAAFTADCDESGLRCACDCPTVAQIRGIAEGALIRFPCWSSRVKGNCTQLRNILRGVFGCEHSPNLLILGRHYDVLGNAADSVARRQLRMLVSIDLDRNKLFAQWLNYLRLVKHRGFQLPARHAFGSPEMQQQGSISASARRNAVGRSVSQGTVAAAAKLAPSKHNRAACKSRVCIDWRILIAFLDFSDGSMQTLYLDHRPKHRWAKEKKRARRDDPEAVEVLHVVPGYVLPYSTLCDVFLSATGAGDWVRGKGRKARRKHQKRLKLALPSD